MNKKHTHDNLPHHLLRTGYGGVVLRPNSTTTRSIARNIHLLSMQRHVKGVNPYDKR